jgi:hypothetical protein
MEIPETASPEILFNCGVLSSFIETEEITATFEEQVVETRAHLAEIKQYKPQLYAQLQALLVDIATTWDPANIVGLLADYGKQYLLPMHMYQAYQADDQDAWPQMLRELVNELFSE